MDQISSEENNNNTSEASNVNFSLTNNGKILNPIYQTVEVRRLNLIETKSIVKSATIGQHYQLQKSIYNCDHANNNLPMESAERNFEITSSYIQPSYSNGDRESANYEMEDFQDTRWKLEDVVDGEQLNNEDTLIFERSRIKALADEREEVQKKTFTKWCNSHLVRVHCRIHNLYQDLRDGRMLINLLEILSGEKLPKPSKGKMRIHCLENVGIALKFLKSKKVHLENVGTHDIVDGNHRLILGLIWTIILRFQIQDISVETEDNRETRSAKDALLLWCQMKTADYSNVNVNNFTSSWRDGLAFNAIIHKHKPDLIKFESLKKSNAMENLQNAFNIAEQELGLSKLLDPEDIVVDRPDEKSIITYVVTYYHYFSKMKAIAVEGKRIGKVLGSAIENDKLIAKYDDLTSDLLQWIEETVEILNDRHFSNSLQGVSSQLSAFKHYRTVEKPEKFKEKGNLEILLFNIQSKMRANNQKVFTPKEGKFVSDINKAWIGLEKAEHARELALREELIRQERLEHLASCFNRKATIRETWLSENQKLVSQDNFGSDLTAVEAATKKHEAIETDVKACKKRVQVVIDVAEELKREKYHDVTQILERKDNVLNLWEYLLELLDARRSRLELNVRLQTMFQQMISMLDWIEDRKGFLESDDLGEHLTAVEDLIQKHSLLEQDINVNEDRISAIEKQSQEFLGQSSEDYCACKPDVVEVRVDAMKNSFNELRQLAAKRRHLLDESRKLHLFFNTCAEEQEWMREQEQEASSGDFGRDLTSVLSLINRHKTVEDEMEGRHALMDQVIKNGKDLIQEQHSSSEKISTKINVLNEDWKNLKSLMSSRKTSLQHHQDFRQCVADSDDVISGLAELRHILLSDDVNRDEKSMKESKKRFEQMENDIDEYTNTISTLKQQVGKLEMTKVDEVDIEERMREVDDKMKDLVEILEDRKRKLADLKSLWKFVKEAEPVSTWIDEKDQILSSMLIPNDMDEMELMKHRFEAFQHEINKHAPLIALINQLARQLINSQHPNQEEITERQSNINAKWTSLRESVDAFQELLNSAQGLQAFKLACQEVEQWMTEKSLLLASSPEEQEQDFAGVLALQRKLSTVERDLTAIQVKLQDLEKEADQMIKEHPDEEQEIKKSVEMLQDVWKSLQSKLEERGETLGEAGDLQKFFKDLDRFQSWLTATQTTIASSEVPQSVDEADKLLQQHHVTKLEIDNYANDYHQIEATGKEVTSRHRDDPQYIFVDQRLVAIDEGWKELDQMWISRQDVLLQTRDLQNFFRDCAQIEQLLTNQEYELDKTERTSLGGADQAEEALKRHELFASSMITADERIIGIMREARRLSDNRESAKIQTRADKIDERHQRNRQTASNITADLREQVVMLRFLADCEELKTWMKLKMLIAKDANYEDARNLHHKWQKHKAFSAELKANKDRLETLEDGGALLIKSNPARSDVVKEKLEELRSLWNELEYCTVEKEKKLFDANKSELFDQSCADLEEFADKMKIKLESEDAGHDLASVTALMKTLNSHQDEIEIRKQEVDELQKQVDELNSEDKVVKSKLKKINEKISSLQAPLNIRLQTLQSSNILHSFFQSIAGSRLWMTEKRPLATSSDVGRNFTEVKSLLKKHQSEINAHQSVIDDLLTRALFLKSPESNCDRDHDVIDAKISQLTDEWESLLSDISARKAKLEEAETAHRYFYDADQATSWLDEHELYMMSSDKAKDDQSAMKMLQKHQMQELLIEDFATTIQDLSRLSSQLAQEQHPQSDALTSRQREVDRVYAAVKDLAGDRRARLQERCDLFRLYRETDDLAEWIASREKIAADEEEGQSLEHVTTLQMKFDEFQRDTLKTGRERVLTANQLADDLVAAGHTDAADVIDLMDAINHAWDDVIDLIKTRVEVLSASHKYYKLACDVSELTSRIERKIEQVPEVVGGDYVSVEDYKRKHEMFTQDVKAISFQVETVCEAGRQLESSYAGPQLDQMTTSRSRLEDAWKSLMSLVQKRTTVLSDALEYFRFVNMVRDLIAWFDHFLHQMDAQDTPNDVLQVERAMNVHQGGKAEVEARDVDLDKCRQLGQQLVNVQHYKSSDIKRQLQTLARKRKEVLDVWDEKWQYFNLLMEVFHFHRDAAACESWVSQQMALIGDLPIEKCESVSQVEELQRRLDALEKGSASWQERFTTLEKLTEMEKREQEQKKRAAEDAERKKKEQEEEDAKKKREEEERRKLKEQAEKRIEKTRSLPPNTDLSQQQSLKDVDTSSGADGDKTSPKEIKQGNMQRKQELDSGGKRASNRSWNNIFCVLENRKLHFYKDPKSATMKSFYRNEQPIDVDDITCEVATDYKKKKHVFRIRTENGSEYLFQAKDHDDMTQWISNFHLGSVKSTNSVVSTPSRTSQIASESPKQKKRLSLLRTKKK